MGENGAEWQLWATMGNGLNGHKDRHLPWNQHIAAGVYRSSPRLGSGSSLRQAAQGGQVAPPVAWSQAPFSAKRGGCRRLRIRDARLSSRPIPGGWKFPGRRSHRFFDGSSSRGRSLTLHGLDCGVGLLGPPRARSSSDPRVPLYNVPMKGGFRGATGSTIR